MTIEPIQVRHISSAFGQWLTAETLRHVRINNRVNIGAPHFLIFFPGGVNAAVLICRADDRGGHTIHQGEYIDYLTRAGWRTAITSGVSDAIAFVQRVRHGAG